MEYFPVCMGILAMSAITPTASPNSRKLTAVSNYYIAESLYRRLRNENPNVEPPPPMDTDTKNRICHHITASSFYDLLLLEDPVHTNQMLDTLRASESKLNLLLDLYDASATFDGTDIHLVYTNPTREVDVYVSTDDEDAIREYVFVCLTTERESQVAPVNVHLISGEYNVSDNRDNSHVAGRFVFRDQLTNFFNAEVYYLAEEPANALSMPGSEVELVYLRTRAEINEPAEYEKDCSVCMLNRHERLRACTVIMNAAYFAGELEFEANYSHIDQTQCRKRRISFKDSHARTLAEEEGRVYEEWMIGCRPTRFYANFQSEYFFSRVHNADDRAFVYRRARGSVERIVIENLFDDVRFKI